MVITYHGAGFIKVTSGETTLAVNPVSKQSKLKQSRFGADIALVSLNHPDFNGIENVTHGDRVPFVVDGPGEYEVKKMIVRGYESPSKYNDGGHLHTIYVVALENMRLCFLSALSDPKLSSALVEVLDNIDILFVPIGGRGTLNPKEAHDIGVNIGSHIIIPTFYDDATLKTFLKEEGEEKNTPVEKLTLKKKDLEGREGRVFVLRE